MPLMSTVVDKLKHELDNLHEFLTTLDQRKT